MTPMRINTGTRELLLAVDAFARANRDQFRSAFTKLCENLTPREVLSQLIAVYLMALDVVHDGTSSIEKMPPVSAAPLLTVYFHLTSAAPLHMTDEILSKWGGDWDEVTCVQCLDCGYLYPIPRTQCKLCRGKVGNPGDWAGWHVRGSVN